MLAKRWNNYWEGVFGTIAHGDVRFYDVEVVDKLFRGMDEHLPYQLYLNDLKPEHGAVKHVMVVSASEREMSDMQWFEMAVGTKWKVAVTPIHGKLRLKDALWQLKEEGP